MSNLSAIVTARIAKLGEAFLKGRMYVSDEVHHSIAKSARIAGLPGEAIRVIPSDNTLRMDVQALAERVAEDRAQGHQPFMVVASAGTINTGAIDPLEELAEVARGEGLWFHVDAAYGGFFQLTERGRLRLKGIERADSITLDPHKGLFLPYGTGCLLARDGVALRKAHEVHAEYLPQPSNERRLPDFSSFSPELTRDFRGLRLWLPLHLHGVDAFTKALDEKLDLATFLYEELRAIPSLAVPWKPELSLVAFRLQEGTDTDTQGLLERINSSDRVWLSSAPIRGQTYVRACILSHRSRPQRIHEAVEIIAAAATTLP